MDAARAPVREVQEERDYRVVGSPALGARPLVERGIPDLEDGQAAGRGFLSLPDSADDLVPLVARGLGYLGCTDEPEPGFGRVQGGLWVTGRSVPPAPVVRVAPSNRESSVLVVLVAGSIRSGRQVENRCLVGVRCPTICPSSAAPAVDRRGDRYSESLLSDPGVAADRCPCRCRQRAP